MPDVFLGSAELWFEAQQLTILEGVKRETARMRGGTHLIRYPPEEIEHFQRVEFFVNCFLEVYTELLLCLDGWCKRAFPLFHLIGCSLCTKLVVNYFQRTDFLDGTVCSGAIWTVYHLPRHGVHCLAQCLPVDIF